MQQIAVRQAHDTVRGTRRAVAASIASMLFVAIVSATPRSPFFAILPPNYEPSGPLRWLADLIGLSNLTDGALMVVGLLATAASAVAFLLVVREAWAGRLPMRTVAILAVVYHVVVLMLPLLFSRDVYSYAYYGRIVSTYGGNPYVRTPDDFPLNSLWPLTWPGWRGTPSVYGPLFTWLSAALTSVAKSIPGMINGFQVVAAAASLATLAIVARLVGRVRPARAVFAVAVIGLNPIVVFHVVGGGHNDMIVAMFVAAAVTALFARRTLLSALLLGLGMSVKASAIVPLILLIVAVVADTPRERRTRVLLTYGGVVAGVWFALALPFLTTQNPSLGLVEAGGHDSWMAPGQVVVRLFSGTAGLIAGDPLRVPAQTIARLCLFAVSAAGVILIGRRIWRDPAARRPAALVAAWGWGLLVLILPSPVLFTWYLMWILPIAWVLPRVGRRSLVILSAILVASHLVTEAALLPAAFDDVNLPFGHPLAILVALWVAREFIRMLRTATPFDEDLPGPRFGDRFEAGGLRGDRLVVVPPSD
ncbi:MAG TPA: glycosyltransferase 87 family protein [Actinomycetota bacterium]